MIAAPIAKHDAPAERACTTTFAFKLYFLYRLPFSYLLLCMHEKIMVNTV